MKSSARFILGIVICFFISFQTANGQIWKKIKKKTQDKVERVVSDKASDKAAEMAANNMDKILNADINPFGKGEKIQDTSDLPESYSFDWKYQMQMQSHVKGEDKKVAIDYYISPGNPYFGFSIPQMPTMFTVMDTEKHAMVAYMEQGSQPVAMAYNLPQTSEDNDEASPEESNLADYTITQLPDKKFMGFNCQGLQLENTDNRVIMYFTTEAGVSFAGAVKSDKAKVPPQLKKYMGDKSQGLVTYMKFIDKKDENKSVTMQGISLDKTILVKSNSNYKFI